MPRAKRSGRKYPRRKLWIKRRNAAFARAADLCEVTGKPLRLLYIEGQASKLRQVFKWRRACHHIIAERWVRRFCAGADPHALENLVVVTPALHAKLTAAENKLFKADWLGYRRELNRLGFSLEMLDRALKAICASVK